jgi:hypothetical protein
MRILQTILLLTVISCSSFRDREAVEVIDPIEFLNFVLTDTTDLNFVPDGYNIISDISILGPPQFPAGMFSDFLLTILAETDTVFIIDQIRQRTNFRTDKLEEHGFTIIKITPNKGIDWLYIYDNIGPGILSVDRPIFNKNYTLAYVRIGFLCGNLCGGGREVILEKKDGKWILKEWISTWTN